MGQSGGVRGLKKYPVRLFLFNVTLNFIVRYSYLLIPGVVLCIVGAWVKMCLALGFVCIAADLAVSLIDQVRNRRRALEEGTHERYFAMMNEALQAGGAEGFRKVLEKKMAKPVPKTARQGFERPYE